VAVVLIGTAVVWTTVSRPAAEVHAVQGVLLEVRASSRVLPDALVLRDADGQIWDFRVDPEVANNREEPQTAGHLRQHMALVEPVLIRYRQTSQGLLAVRVADAP
jgi:hypothetical protein